MLGILLPIIRCRPFEDTRGDFPFLMHVGRDVLCFVRCATLVRLLMRTQLCRRSFASAEMLVKHERKSKLHRENLAKAAVEAGGTAGGDTKGSARVAVT